MPSMPTEESFAYAGKYKHNWRDFSMKSKPLAVGNRCTAVFNFLGAFLAVSVRPAFAQEAPCTIDGYSSELSVRPGDTSALDGLESFTFSAWVYPVFDTVSYEPPGLENPDLFHPSLLIVVAGNTNNPQTNAG
jgi:hypothetical protein